MRTTRALGITLATGALALGGTAGAALAADTGGFTICFRGVTQSFGPEYSLESFVADGALVGACPTDGAGTLPDAPLAVPAASTAGQVVDPQVPDLGSSTRGPDATTPTAVPEPSSVTVDPPRATTATGPVPDGVAPSAAPVGSPVTVVTQDHAQRGTATTTADRDGALTATFTEPVAPSGTELAPPAQAPGPSRAATTPDPHHPSRLAVTGSAGIRLPLLTAAAAIVTGLGLRGASRRRRAGR
ncbi:hypothetical protein MHY85_12850 [Cellulomonas sp. ACRRI]|uniref:hypothetical protein n=1 Tax=Cellulomonas sp. ACRRI TaxID=2918188 RepID=UPI001EF1D554|nr:hypothetical protein [Cellulomonas sp. ACRRI]MCG7286859.1 hypothetical protein [Cellulomonas sp. ACRRI]